jgi:septum formation protein
MSAQQRIVLASRSPRRIELLSRLGVEAEVVPADIDESPFVNEDPVAYVERLARAKATAVHERTHATVILAADTTVDINGEILGQPVDEHDMRRMLRLLSARTHRVHTGVAVLSNHGLASQVVTTLVTFHPVTDETLEWYIATGEPQGKAGSYAIQGLGGTLVERIRGSMSNVVGLPLKETAILLGLNPEILTPDPD